MRYSEELDSCQESQICHQREYTWEQGQVSALVSITLQSFLAETWSSLADLAEASLFRLTGWFRIHLCGAHLSFNFLIKKNFTIWRRVGLDNLFINISTWDIMTNTL